MGDSQKQKSEDKSSPADKSNLEKTYPQKVAENLGTATPEEAEKARAKQEKENDELSKAAATGKSKKDVEEDYDPYLDPVVPSSTLADDIRLELSGLGKSPTLKALRDAKKDKDSE